MEEYYRIKEYVQERPSKLQFYTYFDDEFYCLNEKLEGFKDNVSFIKQFKDVIDYRTRKYYKERLGKKNEGL